MKKKIILWLNIILCVCILSGCNVRLALVDVNVVKVYSSSGHSKDAVLEIYEKFNNTTGMDKNIKFELVFFEQSAYNNTIIEMLAAGDGPDISGIDIDNIVANGYAVYYNDLPGMQEFVEEYYKKIDYPYTGKKVHSLMSSMACMGFVYNKDLFERAGIVDKNGVADPPETYNEVREYAKRITALDNKTFGIALPLAWGNWYVTDIESGSLGDIGFNKFNPKTGKFEFDAYKPIWEMYMGIKEDKSYFPGAEDLDNDPARIQFAEGRIGMKMAGSWDAGVLTSQYPAKCRWGTVPIPTSNKNGPQNYQYTTLSYGPVVTKKGLNKNGGEVMAEAIKFMYSDEFIKFMYKKEKSFPINFDITKDVDRSGFSDGWKDFEKLLKMGTGPNPIPPVKVNSTHTANSVFKNEVWKGKMTVDEGLELLNTTYNSALDKAVENGIINLNNYVNPNYSRLLPTDISFE